MSSEKPNPIRDRWALLIGINQYADPTISNLEFCVNDVQALEPLLRQLGYTVVCLHDQLDLRDSRFPTRNNVEAELIRICQSVGSDDLVLVHFACHGTLIEQQPVLIMQDTRYETMTKTALSVAEIEAQMRSSKARRLVLTLDACHTGVDLGRSMRDFSDPAFIQHVYDLAEGFALIAASTAQQVAKEWEEKQHGLFTYYLLEGLRGTADRTKKGFVTVNDLQTHVLDALRRWNIEQRGRLQEPTFWVEGLGDMILADYRESSKLPNPSQPDPIADGSVTGRLLSASEIRSLVERLTEDEFLNLCQDNFPTVYNNFAGGQSRGSRNRELVTYVINHQELPRLLEAVQQINPNAYSDFAT